jgi:hypothetical protein
MHVGDEERANSQDSTVPGVTVSVDANQGIGQPQRGKW